MPEPALPLHVIGMGAASPIGRGVWANAAAARAGLCGFGEHPFMVDSVGEAMRVARAPWIGIDDQGTDRLAMLAFPVIDEALRPVEKHLGALRLALLLGLPPARPGRPPALAAELQATLAARYGALFDPIETFEAGHAAGHVALQAAGRLLAGGTVRGCVVAGADSYLAPDTLEWIEACDQLHGAGSLNNAWGFIPGEAAGALLVVADPAVAARAQDHYASVIGLGIGQETKLIKTDAVCVGEGLTQAFRAALAAVPAAEQIANIFCDQNGEKYRADEYGFATLRTKERFRSIGDFRALADCWGDIGAAGAIVHVTLAAICHRKRYGSGPLSLVSASSEGGERGAAVVRGIDARAA